MGMRATVSRDMLLENVFVADDAEVLPPGLFGAMWRGGQPRHVKIVHAGGVAAGDLDKCPLCKMF